MPNSALIWIVCSILAVIVILWRWQVARERIRMLEAALHVGSEPILIFDDRNRLVYLSPGLVLFDRRSAGHLAARFHRPPRGQEERGEVEIDGNRYLYRTKLLEYKPGRIGMLIWLEYQRSVTAN